VTKERKKNIGNQERGRRTAKKQKQTGDTEKSKEQFTAPTTALQGERKVKYLQAQDKPGSPGKNKLQS
jgi:hypothetical protein